MSVETLSRQQIGDFHDTVWAYYRQSGRHDLPWRQPKENGEFDPYTILVSELMLQQTQVSRVTPKFEQFTELFPTVEALADSSLAAVLTIWSGLGYNRRAKFLHQAAQKIVNELDGIFPTDLTGLTALPGVGKNTAGAILAYAFNQPISFVETNVRTVYFYHFMQDGGAIDDREVATLVEQTIDLETPREWYWALMDYGSFLKASGIKLNTLSKHYSKQSVFQGSNRQIRGQIIKLLALHDHSREQLRAVIFDSRLDQVLTDLHAENLITKKLDRYHLSD